MVVSSPFLGRFVSFNLDIAEADMRFDRHINITTLILTNPLYYFLYAFEIQIVTPKMC